MELEVRLFIFAEDGQLLPLDKGRFDQAVDRQAAMPEFSGQCLKVAGALVDGGEVQDAFGQFVYFDEKGFVDEVKLIESIRYSDKITEEGYQNEFVWSPSEEDRDRIRKAIG
ncbi:MAG: hypothetical protein R2940_08115 [Syntrophotaleaceae bacterium]